MATSIYSAWKRGHTSPDTRLQNTAIMYLVLVFITSARMLFVRHGLFVSPRLLPFCRVGALACTTWCMTDGVWQDVLPADKADSLLARLLRSSREWTSRPWFNVNGTPGMTHSRSFSYRIPVFGGSSGGGGGSGSSSCGGSRISTSGVVSGTGRDREQACRVHASDEAQRRQVGSCSTSDSGKVTNSCGGGGECVEATGRRRKKEGEPGPNDDVLQSSEDETFDYDLSDAGGEVDSAVHPEGRATAGEPLSEGEERALGSVPDSKVGVMRRASTSDDNRRRSATTAVGERLLDEVSEVAPEELLEVVPHVVEAVRRCLSRVCVRCCCRVCA